MNGSDSSDIIVQWPDGAWCFYDEIEDFGAGKSDDYTIIQVTMWSAAGEPVGGERVQ